MSTENENKIVGEPEPPKWEFRSNFAINNSMREVIELAVKLAQSEVDRYREKLRRLTYGA